MSLCRARKRVFSTVESQRRNGAIIKGIFLLFDSIAAIIADSIAINSLPIA